MVSFSLWHVFRTVLCFAEVDKNPPNRRNTLYVHDLGLFVTVQVLDETPAVLSLGKLCEDHGYSYEWVSGQKPLLTEVKTITCKIDNHVPPVVPELSAHPGSSS